MKIFYENMYNFVVNIMPADSHEPFGISTSAGSVTVILYLISFPVDKMAAISQTAFSNAFSWMKNFVFWFKFHWGLFLRVQLTISQHWFKLWLGTEQVPSHYLGQYWPSSLTHICGTRGRWVIMVTLLCVITCAIVKRTFAVYLHFWQALNSLQRLEAAACHFSLLDTMLWLSYPIINDNNGCNINRKMHNARWISSEHHCNSKWRRYAGRSRTCITELFVEQEQEKIGNYICLDFLIHFTNS